jgi:secreted trypsin-like serine protease
MVVVIAVGCLASPASAGTILHTVRDQDYLALGGSPAYASVGQIIGTDALGSFAGSGVLIAPNWVLTAAHVVDSATSLYFDFDGGSVANRFAAKRWVAYPSWDGNLNKGYDIGLVEFGVDLATKAKVSPAERYRGVDELGKIGTSVGFGTTGTGVTGWQNVSDFSELEKRAGNNYIDAWLRTPGKTSRVFLSDFDNPAPDGTFVDDGNNFGGADPLPLEYSTAPGDSGGGVFVDGVLVGIHSFGWGRLDGNPNSDYDDVSGHTRVSAFNDWIDSIISGGGGGKPKPPHGPKNTSDATALGGAAVPEPSTLWLLCIGGLCLVGWWRKRRR